MATTLKTSYDINITSVETLDAAVSPGLTNRNISHNGFNFSGVLSGTSSPPVSIVSEFTLGAASGTIDLTSLLTTQGTRSAIGLKLRILRIRNRSLLHAFSIQVGGSNGYAILGAAIPVPVGGWDAKCFGDALLAIDGTHKTLDWTISSYVSPDAVDMTLILG